MAEDKLLDVEIVTPNKTIYSGRIQSITLPGSKAPFQVLFNHAPIVSSLEIGSIKLVDENGKDVYFASTDGFTEVSRNVVSVMVESAEEASQINVDDVSTALHELKEKLNNAPVDEVKRLKKMIEINENKLKIAKKNK